MGPIPPRVVLPSTIYSGLTMLGSTFTVQLLCRTTQMGPTSGFSALTASSKPRSLSLVHFRMLPTFFSKPNVKKPGFATRTKLV